MSLPVHTVRRATINDLAALRSIWSEERFAVGELEARFTEFQVVETSDGQIIGALALQIQGKQGHLHSETIAKPEHTEALRTVLWERLKKVAENHGLMRLWTSAAHTHWMEAEFRAPSAAEQEKCPAQFGETPGGWLILQLKEESAQAISLEQELAIFREAQKAESEAFHQQAQKMRLIATLVAFLFLVAVLIGGFYWFQYIKDPDKFKKAEPVPGSEVQPELTPPVPAPAPTNAPLPQPAPIPPPPGN
jgi:N-acetylglutamate synthase-like GNAT family acetyltransferase